MAVCAPKPTRVEVPGPSEQELRSCLTDHGLEVPGGDGVALKRWLLAHGDDEANREAMKACDMAPVAKPADGGACSKEGVVGRWSPPAAPSSRGPPRRAAPTRRTSAAATERR